MSGLNNIYPMWLTSVTNSDAKHNDNTNDKKRNPKCALCLNHDEIVAVKGHKRKCPFKSCLCKLCLLTIDRRDVMAKTIAVRRKIKEDKADNSYKPPVYLPENESKCIVVADNCIINSSKERYNNSPYLKEAVVNQITISAVRLCFKKIIDHITEQFRLSLPNDWIDSLEESLEIMFSKKLVNNQLSVEVDKIFRDAFLPVLEEYTKKKLQIESHHSAFQKVVPNNSQAEYSQSILAKENSVNPTNSKPKSLQSLQMLVNGDSHGHHRSQLPLEQSYIPYPSIYMCNNNHYQNGMNNGHVLSPAAINGTYQPFGTTMAVNGYHLESQDTPLPKSVNISHSIYRMIGNNANYAKQSNANNTESKINNSSSNCANSKYSGSNDISSTPKKKALAQYIGSMKVNK